MNVGSLAISSLPSHILTPIEMFQSHNLAQTHVKLIFSVDDLAARL